jgi:hypothetical protein
MYQITRKRRKPLLAENAVARARTNDERRALGTQTAPAEQESRSLFHYTTADGVIGILQNQSSLRRMPTS